MYTMVGVGVSAVIFGTARYFARDPPKTMTKEYQEKMNEYLQVGYPYHGMSFSTETWPFSLSMVQCGQETDILSRVKTSSQSLVYRQKDSRVVMVHWSRASRETTNRRQPAILSIPCIFEKLLERNHTYQVITAWSTCLSKTCL